MAPTVLLDVWAAAMWRACWEGGLLVLVVGTICRLIPSMPARLQCWFWRLAVLKFVMVLLCPTLLNLPLLPAPPVPAPLPEITLPAAASMSVVMSAIPVEQVEPNPLPSLSTILCFVWVIGASWSLARLLIHWRRATRLQNQSHSIASTSVMEQLTMQGKLFGLRRLPRVVEVEGSDSPMLIGTLRPTIVFPTDTLRKLSISEQTMVLGHELAHVRRWDLFWGLMASVVRAIFFFHPLVSWSERQLRFAQEVAADQLAIARQRRKPVNYAGLLVSVVGKLGPRPSVTSIAVETAGTAHSLAKRLIAMTRTGYTSRRVIAASGILLIAVVLLGLVPWRLVAAEPKEGEKRPSPPSVVKGPPTGKVKAIAEIEKLGGKVLVNETSKAVFGVDLSGAKVTDAGIEHLQGLTGLQWLSLNQTKVTDAGLEHLKGLTNLQDLLLAGTQVTDAGLGHLKGLTKLQRLDLTGTPVTDAGLEYLKGLTNLQLLLLTGTQVTDAGLERLQGLTELQCLSLKHTKVTDAGLKHLKGLTKLQSLDLTDTQVTDAGLKHLKGLTKLQSLDLTDTQVTDAGLEYLKGLTKLQTLNLNHTKVTDAGLEYLKGLTNLQWLLLTGTKVTDAGLEHLKGLAKLQALDLTGFQVTDAGLEHLQGLTELVSLNLNRTKVTDVGLGRLQGLTKLQTLVLTGTQVTDAGLEHLKGLTKLQALDLMGTQMTDAGLEHLQGLTELTSLNLNDTKVTDAGLGYLQGLTKLQTLGLNGAPVTDAGCEHLQGLTKLISLSLRYTKVSGQDWSTSKG